MIEPKEMRRIAQLNRDAKPKKETNKVKVQTREVHDVVITKKTKTVRQTAWILSTSTNNVYDLIHMGKLRALKLGDTAIPDAEIDRFLTWALDSGADLNALIDQYRQEQKAKQQEEQPAQSGRLFSMERKAKHD
ncbi:hypothetical protein [Schleiferilactobacillus shenzhenensis]|uniref:Helix-turn-helix domain-containing protein n=1 Tax=Schleiferilactobacillus shenzhenensis LY-73 TaxID=1231336 RepID=U4TPM1_9LACO|nr:hypothetical protein [Schleiferilactobacillus shenzhenensis]ERL63823.1 hypothetical protein L248_2116 [Schleiferilactobacillus shenzhenensis LY-73]